MMRSFRGVSLVVVLGVTLGAGCAVNKADDSDGGAGTDDGTASDTTSDTGVDTGDTDGTDETDGTDGTDGTESESLTESDTNGHDCATPILVPDDQATWSYESDWQFFTDDNFDSSQSGCSYGHGTTVWFQVEVPAGETLEIERLAGVVSMVNIVDDCAATTCLAGAVNVLTWVNAAAEDRTVLVVIESDFAITQSPLSFEFRRYLFHGDVCEDPRALTAPWPASASEAFADFKHEVEPASCGSPGGPSAWYEVVVPAATRLTATLTTSHTATLGLAEECGTCVASSVAYYYSTPATLSWTNEGSADVPLAIVVGQYYSSDTAVTYDLSVDLVTLPEGDTCGDAIAVTTTPHLWDTPNPLLAHNCSVDVCPATSGPDVWFAVTLPPGDLVSARATTGEAPFIAVVDDCAATEALAFSLSLDGIIYQNTTASPLELFIVAGAVAGTTLDDYEFEIDVRTPIPGDLCGSPIAVPPEDASSIYAGGWADFGDEFHGAPSCLVSAGADLWFTIDVDAGERLTVTETGGADAVIHLFDGCGEPCLASTTAGDSLSIVNADADPVTWLVAVESAAAAPADPDVTVEFTREETGPGVTCGSPIAVDLATSSWSGSWSLFSDSIALSELPGCGSSDGREAFFAVEVGPDESLFVSETTQSVPVTLQLLEGCGQEARCTQHGEDWAVWHNVTGAAATVLVAAEARYPTTVAAPLNLSFSRVPIFEGDACAVPLQVTLVDDEATMSVDLWEISPSWPTDLCLPAAGNDVWFAVEVPAGQLLTVRELTSADVVLTTTTTCPPVSCEMASDAPETALFANPGATPATALVVAAAATIADNASRIDLGFSLTPIIAGDVCVAPHALALAGDPPSASWTGHLGALGDDFSGQAGCTGFTTDTEAWFAVEVPAGQWLSAAANPASAARLAVVESCWADECLAANLGSLMWHNDAEEAVTVFLVAESADEADPEVTVEASVFEAPATFFGPDAYGYWGATDTDLSACADISATGSALVLSDEGIQSASLGMTFPIYDVSFTSAWISANGYLSFGATSSGGAYNTTLPSSSFTGPAIAGYWDDLEAGTTPQGTWFLASTVGGVKRFQVQWRTIPYYFTSSLYYDFSVVLEETGRIHVCYVDSEIGDPSSDKGLSATAGIQRGPLVGLPYSYNEAELTSGLHLWFVRP